MGVIFLLQQSTCFLQAVCYAFFAGEPVVLLRFHASGSLIGLLVWLTRRSKATIWCKGMLLFDEDHEIS